MCIFPQRPRVVELHFRTCRSLKSRFVRFPAPPLLVMVGALSRGKQQLLQQQTEAWRTRVWSCFSQNGSLRILYFSCSFFYGSRTVCSTGKLQFTSTFLCFVKPNAKRHVAIRHSSIEFLS